jgi:hypothetical protein
VSLLFKYQRIVYILGNGRVGYMSLWGVREEVLWQPQVRGLLLGPALIDDGEFRS